MATNLEVDAFEIDIETLEVATKQGFGGSKARWKVVEEVMRNLDPDSIKRFEEYHEQNDPCKEVKNEIAAIETH